MNLDAHKKNKCMTPSAQTTIPFITIKYWDWTQLRQNRELRKCIFTKKCLSETIPSHKDLILQISFMVTIAEKYSTKTPESLKSSLKFPNLLPTFTYFYLTTKDGKPLRKTWLELK